MNIPPYNLGNTTNKGIAFSISSFNPHASIENTT